MLDCSSCKVKPTAGTPYEKTPCAVCPIASQEAVDGMMRRREVEVTKPPKWWESRL